MNHKSLTGREVISIESGRKLGQIERVLFDPSAMKIDSIVIYPQTHSMMEEPGPMQRVKVDQIRGLGQDVVTVENDEAMQTMSVGESTNNLVAFDQIENEAVLTESGKKVGALNDIEFNEQSMQLESIQVSHGFLSRKSSISVNEIVSVGEDAIIVHDAAMPDLPEEPEEPEEPK